MLALAHHLGRGLLTICTALALALCAPGAARAQPCEGQWLPGFGLQGVFGSVSSATAWDPDGPGPQAEVVVAGGSFSVAGTHTVINLAIYDGQDWHPFPAPAPFGAAVLRVYAHGPRLYIDTSTSATNRSRIHAWQDGAWQPIGNSFNGFVRAMIEHDGRLIIAGSLQLFMPQGAVETGVATFDGTRWMPLGDAPSADVYALEVHEGCLIAGGEFSQAGLIPAHGIAAWDGAGWAGMGAPTGTRVNDLLDLDGTLHAASLDSTRANTPFLVTRLVRGLWQPMGTLRGHSAALLRAPDGTLQLTAWFSGLGNVGRYASWTGQDWQVESRRSVPGMTLREFPVASLGGAFVLFGKLSINGLGNVEQPFVRRDTWVTSSAGTNGPVSALLSHNGDVYVGGSFSRFAGRTSGGLVKLNAEQISVPYTDPLGGVLPTVSSMTLWNERLAIFAGGYSWLIPLQSGAPTTYDRLYFSEAGSYPRLLTHEDRLLIGQYTNPEFIPRQPVLASFSNGWSYEPWAPVASLQQVHRVNERNLIMTIGVDIMPDILRYDGVALRPLVPGLKGQVAAVLDLGDRWVLAGGPMLLGTRSLGPIVTYDGVAVEPLGHFHPLQPAGRPPSYTPSNRVQALNIFDARIVATGSFRVWTPQGQALNLASFDGQHWRAMGALAQGAFPGRALTASRGTLYVGGSFLYAGGRLSPFIARYVNPCRCGLADVAATDGTVGPDGALTVDDLRQFMEWFAAGDVRADIASGADRFAGDGQGSTDDILAFVGAFFAPCPGLRD